MLFFAYHLGQYIFSGSDFDAVLAFVLECIDSTAPAHRLRGLVAGVAKRRFR